MKKFVAWLLFAVVLLSAAPVLSAEYIVFIVAGQSNARGNGKTSELSLSRMSIPSNLQVYNGFFRLQSFGDLDHFGPELMFSRKIALTHPDQKIIIVKYAVPGTSLYAWSPDWTPELASVTNNADKGPLYHNLLTRIHAATDGKDVEFGGMLWVQGERDSHSQIAADNYLINLQYLVYRLRTDIGKPDMPFLLAQINPRVNRFQYVNIVRNAQNIAPSAIPYCTVISTKGLPKGRGKLHYNTKGQLTLGIRFFNSYLTL